MSFNKTLLSDPVQSCVCLHYIVFIKQKCVTGAGKHKATDGKMIVLLLLSLLLSAYFVSPQNTVHRGTIFQNVT